eukprot:m.25252 g.25252  ORF g.25252 m.25252 type:complete len:55 (+) comp11577_c0_seq1:1-165(+)
MIVITSIWFFGSSVSQNLLKTGAFEIYLDGMLRDALALACLRLAFIAQLPRQVT